MPKKKEWFDDDALWRAVMPVLFDKMRIENASGEVDDMIALAGVRPGSRVLDLCCGIGRHSVQFAKRGFEVTGVDKTRRYLAEARRSARGFNVPVRFVLDDMLHYRKDNFYDLVISYFSSFGYFEKKDDDQEVAENVCASLVRGGKLLLDIVGKETIARNYQKKNWREEEGFLLLEERIIEKNWTGINTRWIIVKDRNRTDLNVYHRLYSAIELIDLLKQSGFSDVKVYGDIKGKPYDADATRLIAVAVK
jgi:SAM-dependent methyltransferase